MTTIISDVTNFDANSITFSKIRENPKIPGSYRIYLNTRTPDGESPILFCTDTVFSFGVQETKSLVNKDVTTGYTLPICLHDMDGPTEEQEAFIEALNSIVEKIKQFLLTPAVKQSIKRFDMVESDLRKLNPIYRKIDPETGLPVSDKGPTLYPKLITTRDLKIQTEFADMNGRYIEPMTLLGNKFKVRVLLHIESVFIGSKISIQIRVKEAEVHQKSNGKARLMLKKAPVEEVVEEEPEEETKEQDEEDVQSGEPVEQEQEREPTPSPPQEEVVSAPKQRGGRRKLNLV